MLIDDLLVARVSQLTLFILHEVTKAAFLATLYWKVRTHVIISNKC